MTVRSMNKVRPPNTKPIMIPLLNEDEAFKEDAGEENEEDAGEEDEEEEEAEEEATGVEEADGL